MKLLYVGESWQGSNARSVREALAALPGVVIQELCEDHFLPRYSDIRLRIANRLLRRLQIRDLGATLMRVCAAFKPDAVVAYRGSGVSPDVVDAIRAIGIPLINIFPDYSPHAFGTSLREAIGRYDLVISAKPFHAPLWKSTYGYHNACVCVPHGYDPQVHLWHEPAQGAHYDLAVCAMWRPEYQRLLRELVPHLGAERLNVAIGGGGWDAHARDLPRHWRFTGRLDGPAYGDFLRSARIVIAPLNREVVVNGTRQPGDEDTTRTYELAAAYCFFLHQRTDYVQTVYDERTEVPMWSDARELASQIRRWLPDVEGRRSMAKRAHERAVPAYSIPVRTREILARIETVVAERRT
jgi:spore maturation protein CgeB